MSEKGKSNKIKIVWKKGTAKNSFVVEINDIYKYKNAHIQNIDGFHDNYRKVIFLSLFFQVVFSLHICMWNVWFFQKIYYKYP